MTPPPPRAAAPFVAPTIERFVLSSGVVVLAVENHRLPLVALATIHGMAGSREDGEHPGLAALTADLLDEGAGTLSSGAIAEQLERLGARLSIAIASDAATISVTTLADQLPHTVDLLADVIRRPRFTGADIVRVRADRIAELALERDRPRVIAAQLFDRVVFGEHPYAHAADGTPDSVKALTANLVRAFWKTAYGPATTTIVVAGDFEPAALRALLEHAFGDWNNPQPSPPRTPPVAGPVTRQLAYVDRPGAPQTVVMIGRRSLAAGDARAIPAEVLNTLLGGSFASRLNHRLREELGYTYGIGSNFWRGAWGGTWTVSSSIKTAETAAAVREALRLIDDARTTDVTPAELVRTQQLLDRGLPQAFETDSGTVRALERLVDQQLPLDSWKTYEREVASVTAASARAVIAPLWADLTIVVVGDWSVIGAGLGGLGLPVVAYDAAGAAIP